MTATAVMQLVEEGKLDLDTDINRYLPFTIRNPKVGGVITLRHLLAHTASLSDSHYYALSQANPNPPALHYYPDADPSLSLADFCRGFFSERGTYYSPDTFREDVPGTVGEYSNIGYALAGYIVEYVSGESFATYTKRRIFARLGMTRTSWRVADFTVADMAMPYGNDGQPLGNYTFADYPDGGMRTTVRDLSRFLRAFIQEGTLEGVTILRPATVREMKRIQYPNAPDSEREGLGVNVQTVGSTTVIGHAGAERGVSTLMYFNVQTGSGAIVLTNGSLRDLDDYNAQNALLKTLIEEADKT